MKSSRIMKIFEQYVRKYDMNNINIKARYFHSLKVMEIVKDLATELGIFTEEEIAVCELIGLFHENRKVRGRNNILVCVANPHNWQIRCFQPDPSRNCTDDCNKQESVLHDKQL